MTIAALHLPPGEAFDASAGGAGTLVASWRRRWEQAPGARAVFDPARGWLTRGDLARESEAAARRLAALGVRAGERVLTSGEPSAALVVAHVACLRLGAAVVPANTAYRADEIAHLVRDAEPVAALVEGEERAAWVRAADARMRIATPALAGLAEERAALDEAAPADAALIGYTSGTTGRPKGAVLSHANLLASAEALRLAWRWSERDVLVLALPLFHMHGLGVGVHGTLHAGASAVLVPRFSPEAVLAAARAHGATLFFGVPTMYHRLVSASDAAALRALRLCVSGSAPLDAELFARFEALTGQRILERYGMTETAMLVSNPHDGERRPGTVGLPLPGVALRLAASGEIEVRGPNVFAGYWRRPGANAEAFTPDGWFRTGDVGERDPAGYLRIVGRAKELILSGGFNVYPREVEDALAQHPAVREVAVVGTPSAEWGEVVTAYVVSDAPLGADELRAFLADRLAAYKQPRLVHRVAALPRNALGKVQRQRLQRGEVLPE
jgi:malonyl-CoA/methylmalonyl-CoA synthetase